MVFGYFPEYLQDLFGSPQTVYFTTPNVKWKISTTALEGYCLNFINAFVNISTSSRSSSPFSISYSFVFGGQLQKHITHINFLSFLFGIPKIMGVCIAVGGSFSIIIMSEFRFAFPLHSRTMLVLALYGNYAFWVQINIFIISQIDSFLVSCTSVFQDSFVAIKHISDGNVLGEPLFDIGNRWIFSFSGVSFWLLFVLLVNGPVLSLLNISTSERSD